MSLRPRVVAIDGPAGVGKSTIARRLAADLGWAYLDTGAMYRAVTRAALDRGVPLGDGAALAALAHALPLHLSPDGTVRVGGLDVTESLRTPEVNGAVSAVAGVAEVRAVMVEHQRRFAAENGRIVVEGRDVGTVVFPDATVKIYLDAHAAERTRRRVEQIRTGGEAGRPDAAAVRAGLDERDRLDSSRPVAPLRRAEDAWYLDTTPLPLE